MCAKPTARALRRIASRSRITPEIHTQAVNSHKRAAQSKVVRMMVPNPSETRVVSHPEIGAKVLTAPLLNP